MTTKPAAPPRANANPSPASAPVPNTSMQVQSCSSNLSPPRSLAPGSPASSSTASHQASPTAAFQPQASPSASAPAPRSLIRKVLDEPGIWIGVGLAIAAVVVAIYYGAVMLSYAKWTKHNDFREGCINDREHKLPLSTECSEELLRSRVAAMAKRQIGAAHSALLGEHGIRFAGMEFAASFALVFAICAGFSSLSKNWKDIEGRVPGFMVGVFGHLSLLLLILALVLVIFGAMFRHCVLILPRVIFHSLRLLWNTLRKHHNSL
jgi:hypothetical protein